MSMPQRAFLQPDYGPSYKPTDTDDLGKCIRRRSGLTQVWCVKCGHWHSLEIMFFAHVTIIKDGVTNLEPSDKARFYCRACSADVDYIIDFNGKRTEVLKEYLEQR